MRFKALIVLALLLVAGKTQSETPNKFKASDGRTIIIAEIIDESGAAIADKIETLSKTSEDIDFVISSPGGSIFYGLKIMSAMRIAKARGVTLKCVVIDHSASMAMMIFDQCNKRYALHDANLLWHDAAISGRFAKLRIPELQGMAAELEQFGLYLEELRLHLNMNKKTFEMYRQGEVEILAIKLKSMSPLYLDLVDDIEGVDHIFSLKNPYKVFNPLSIFGA